MARVKQCCVSREIKDVSEVGGICPICGKSSKGVVIGKNQKINSGQPVDAKKSCYPARQ